MLRGPVLADLPGLDAADALLASVRSAVREAAVDLGAVAVQAGRAEAAVAPLEALADAHPLDEPMHARLIEVLAACGRPSEALRRYELLRRRLAEELGVSPSVEVQRAHLAVLVRDRELAGMPVRDGLAGELSWLQSSWCLLPPDIADFTGRDAQVGLLERWLTCGSGGPATEVLDWLLRVLGLHGAAIPADLEERSGLYRSVLAGRRVLVVLDNAASETQVLPLLPGDPSCGVLVTSRQRLGGLPGVRLSRSCFASASCTCGADSCERPRLRSSACWTIRET